MRPIRLSRRLEPFDSDQFIFELKIDGFRALAHIEAGEGKLISRNGNTFRGFADLATWIAEHLRVESAILDGEIACVDEGGRPVFRDLLFRRRQCVFIAFDLLYLNGRDLRTLPLIERKAMLKKLLQRKRSRILPGIPRFDDPEASQLCNPPFFNGLPGESPSLKTQSLLS
jgi:bifunctional non-homologous end joining protein LigD